MIVKEFEGKNEKEAIDRAIEELGLDRNEIDFEIVEAKRPGILFRGGKVKIRVHLSEEQEEFEDEEQPGNGGSPAAPRAPAAKLPPSGEFEATVIDFLRGLLERMGFPGEVSVTFREDGRLGLDIESDGSGILIGKQGKTLEALQFIVNLAAGRMVEGNTTRIVLDTQDYRSRRERSLIRMANQVAEQVRRSRESQLLEPLNPFERRLIHTSLARYGDIETVSEGDGLYKRIRVICRGDRERE